MGTIQDHFVMEQVQKMPNTTNEKAQHVQLFGQDNRDQQFMARTILVRKEQAQGHSMAADLSEP